MNGTNRHGAPDPQPDALWLAAALREQAHEHEADSGRISARFEHLMAGERRPGEPRRAEPRRFGGPARLRLIGVPLGLLVLASATVAVATSLGLGNTPAAHPSSTAAAAPGGTGFATATTGPGPLSASSAALNSSPYWAQENLTVTTTRPIRELDVTVAVSGGPAVRSTGMWTTLLPPEVATTVRSEPDGLVYEITLKPGQTLQPTAYMFGFQFNRPSAGHEFTLDTYRVTAVTTDGASESASGAF